jgi:hypothetical protein
MRAAPVEFIEYHYRPPVKGEAVELSDEFLRNFLDDITKGLQHTEEIGQRVTGYEARTERSKVGEAETSVKVMEGLLARNRVHVLPRATVVIGDTERVLELVVGTTVAKVKKRCDVPADWQGIVDEQPVAEDYPILRDCILRFRPSVEEAMATMCRAIYSQGYCQQREDSQNWISVTELRETLTDEKLRILSEKELRTLLRREGVRMRKPSQQRLQVHCGDWLHFLARRARQQEQVLEAAADPDEIKPLTDEMKGTARLIRRLKGDD